MIKTDIQTFWRLLLFPALFVAPAFAVTAVANSELTELDCWTVKEFPNQDPRGMYLGWLTIDLSASKINWSRPLNSEDGPNGEFMPFRSEYLILEDRFSEILVREKWVQAVDIDNRSFLFVNRETGRFLFNGLNWVRRDEEPDFDFQHENIEGFCENRKDVF
jgi:hypothetical protein